MSMFKTALHLLRTDRSGFNMSIVQRLAKMKISHILPDKFMVSIQYKAHFGKKLDLKNPKTFNEKLQWLKLYNRKPDQIKLVDKYEVKKYISDILGEEYIIPTLGVYDSFDEIDFSKLPEQFVLKCTHDSGSVVLCHNKAEFNIEAAKAKINRKMKQNLYWHGREWPYKNLKPRIIAEQFMQCDNGEELIDYKFFCFNGNPEFLYVSQGLSNHETGRISYVFMDWQQAPFYRNDFEQFEKLPDKPKTFEQMILFSKKLAKDHPFARVDFYEINGKLYFGEITFYPGAGFTKFYPEEWDMRFGERLVLPEVAKNR